MGFVAFIVPMACFLFMSDCLSSPSICTKALTYTWLNFVMSYDNSKLAQDVTEMYPEVSKARVSGRWLDFLFEVIQLKDFHSDPTRGYTSVASVYLL